MEGSNSKEGGTAIGVVIGAEADTPLVRPHGKSWRPGMDPAGRYRRAVAEHLRTMP